MRSRLLLAAAGVCWLSGCRETDGRPATNPVADRGRVVVEVLNGSGRRGLARAATRVLRQAGFDVVYFGNLSERVAVSQALARRGDSTLAARVARAIGATQVRMATDTLLRVDVTVLLGADYRAPPGVRP